MALPRECVVQIHSQIFKWIYLIQHIIINFDLELISVFWDFNATSKKHNFGLFYIESEFVFSEPDSNLFHFLCEHLSNLSYFLTLSKYGSVICIKTNFCLFLLTWHGRSFTYKLNKRGPKMEPWGTPKRIGSMSDCSSLILQVRERSQG